MTTMTTVWTLIIVGEWSDDEDDDEDDNAC